jgi:hypothetical protein
MPGLMLSRAYPSDGRQSCQAHALDLLWRFDHAHFGKQRRGVHDFGATGAKSIVKPLPVDRRFANHAVTDL